MDDIVSLLLYVVMILAAFIASAYQAKKRKSQQNQGPVTPGRQEDLETGGNPDFGPLGDFFDMQEKKEMPPVYYETLEAGPSVEEEGAERERSVVYEPLTASHTDIPASPEVNQIEPAGEFFEEGQSDLKRMDAMEEIAAYLTDDGVLEDIAAGEIVSVEKEAEALAKKGKIRTDWRQAIIYSEILKRREY